MSDTTTTTTQTDSDYVPETTSLGQKIVIGLLAVAAAVAVPLLLYVSLNTAFDLMQGISPVIVGLVAILISVVGIFAVYTVVDLAIKRLPPVIGRKVQPYAWSGPALVVLSVFLVYPAINTVRLSFYGPDSREWVGFANYEYVFQDEAMVRSLVNTLGWVIVVPAVAVAIGLGFAVLADKLKRMESLAKSLIFLPMAISFIGAGIVWRFVYDFRVEGSGEQIGVLNAIWTSMGNSPIDWLALQPWNNLMLMIIMVWLQTGFAMVVLSSAIKGVPNDIIEAARIDGATEIEIFWQVIVPNIMSSIVVVFTTMVIGVLKVFDIVWVMTGGQDGTEVIAERMIRNMFTFRDWGKGSAVAVFMFLAVIPIMIINIRRFREEEATR